MRLFGKTEDIQSTNPSLWSRLTKSQRKQEKKSHNSNNNNNKSNSKSNSINNNSKSEKKKSSITSIPPKIRISNDTDEVYDENDDSGCIISNQISSSTNNPNKNTNNNPSCNDSGVGIFSLVPSASSRKDSALSNSATSGSVNFRLSLQSLRGNSGSVHQHKSHNKSTVPSITSSNQAGNNLTSNQGSYPSVFVGHHHKSIGGGSGFSNSKSTGASCIPPEQLEAKLRTSKHQCEQLKRKVANLSLECQKLENQCKELKEVKDQLINLQSDLSMLKRKDKISSEIQQRINALEEDNYHMRNHIDKLRSKIKEISLQLDPEIINKRLDTLEEENSQLTSISLQNRRNHEAFSLDVGNQLVETFITQQTIYDEFRRLQHRLISVERQNQIMADLIHLHCHQNNMISNYSNNSSAGAGTTTGGIPDDDNSRHSDGDQSYAATASGVAMVGPPQQSLSTITEANTSSPLLLSMVNNQPMSMVTTSSSSSRQHQQTIIDNSYVVRDDLNFRYSTDSPLFNHHRHNHHHHQRQEHNPSGIVTGGGVNEGGRPLSYASSSITTPTYYSEDRDTNRNTTTASQTNIDGLSSDPGDSNYQCHSLNKKMSECQLNDYYQINFSYCIADSATTLSKTAPTNIPGQYEINPNTNPFCETQDTQPNTNNPGNNNSDNNWSYCQCSKGDHHGGQQKDSSDLLVCSNCIKQKRIGGCGGGLTNTSNSPCSQRAGDDGYFSTSTNRTTTLMMVSNESTTTMPAYSCCTTAVTSTTVSASNTVPSTPVILNDRTTSILLQDRKERYFLLSHHVQKSRCRSIRKYILKATETEYEVQLSMDLETSQWSRDIRRRQHRQRDMTMTTNSTTTNSHPSSSEVPPAHTTTSTTDSNCMSSSLMSTSNTSSTSSSNNTNNTNVTQSGQEQEDQVLVFSDTELFGSRFHIDSDLEDETIESFRMSLSRGKLFVPKKQRASGSSIPIPTYLRAYHKISNDCRPRSSLPPLIENASINNGSGEKRKIEIRSNHRQHQKHHKKSSQHTSKLVPPKIRPRSMVTSSVPIAATTESPSRQNHNISSSSKPPPKPRSNIQNNKQPVPRYHQSTIPPPIPPRLYQQRKKSPSPMMAAINSKIPSMQDYANDPQPPAPHRSSRQDLVSHHSYHEDEDIDEYYDPDFINQLENYQLPNSCLNMVVLQHFK